MCESCGVLQGALPEERVDRGEAHIAGGDAVAPVVLQVLKKREDRLWPEVVQVRGCPKRSRRVGGDSCPAVVSVGC